MSGTKKSAVLWSAVALGATALFVGPAARASTILTADLTNSYIGTGCTSCGPFGAVTVSSTGDPDQVLISLTLEPGEVFAIAGGNGAGKPLLFDIAGDPTNLSMTMVQAPTGTQASWFGLQMHQMVMADGTGTWSDAIVCNSSCATGVSGGYSGTLSFLLTAQSPLTAASFIQNVPTGTGSSAKGGGLYFASDIGVPGGATGDVAAPAVSVVPLPAAAWLFAGGLGWLGLLRTGRKAS